MNKNSLVTLLRTDSANRDFQYLVVLMDHDLRERYGSVQSVYNELNQVADLDTIVVAYDEQQAVGCGCFRKFSDNTAEIKRMYVEPSYCGQGIAVRILNELELWAGEKGFNHAILETGRKQPEAIHLYERSGYATTINYGPYDGLDNSICMRKKL
jgi:GNAT superfamily N-acetyltransferase